MLSDDQKRAQYDQFGHAGANQGFGGFGGGGDFGGGFGFEDIFSSFFGGGMADVVIQMLRAKALTYNIKSL